MYQLVVKQVISFRDSNLDIHWNMARSPRLKCLVAGSLLLLLLFSTICSGQTIYYIKPTPSMSCPSPSDPCLTLSEYTQQPLHYLTSNTTLLLLPGNHVLSANFTVENVCGFEIMSFAPADSQATRIVCQGLVGFSFQNISHLTMHGLTINSCGKGSLQHLYLSMYGVLVDSVLDTSISNCSFQDSVGTALGGFHSSLDLRGSNSFTSNCRRCTERRIFGGGGIHARNSNLSFSGNTIFRNNSAEIFGGGIYARNSTLNFSGSSVFGSNTAGYRGGGIAAESSTINFSGSSTFGSNTAGYHGGGIGAMWNTLVTFSGNIFFRNNYGGGIAAWLI